MAKIKIALGIGAVAKEGLESAGALTGSEVAKKLASKLSAPLGLVLAIGAVGLFTYEYEVKRQPNNWEHDFIIDENPEPIEYMPPGMEDFSNS